MGQQEPESEALGSALPHVRYEVEAVLLTPTFDTANPMLRETVELRRRVHARALADFFNPPEERRRPCPQCGFQRPSKSSDDIYAFHFGFKPKLPDSRELRRERCRMNKEIFHITYSRKQLSDADKAWHVGFLDEVQKFSRTFVDWVIDAGPHLWLSIEERKAWMDLRDRDRLRHPLEQFTANTASQITTQELARPSRNLG